MKTRTLWRWIGIAAQLYVLFMAILFGSNIATIVLINGWPPLTRDVLLYIFARDAIMAIGFAVVGCFFVAFFNRSLRRRLSRQKMGQR